MRLKEEIEQLDTKEKYHPTKEDIDYWFKLINRTIYLGELTPFPIIKIRRMQCMWGCVFYDDKIRKSNLELHMMNRYPSKRFFVEVLAHEMVHKWQMDINIDSGNHNKHFYSWREKYAEHGLNLSGKL